MNRARIVVIGSSAGGVYVLEELVAALPADFRAPIFIVQHVAPDVPSLLPDILNYAGKLPASHPFDGERIQPGHIYVAPPDHHMLVEQEHIIVKKGPKENRFRPSIDALFRPAAYTYGAHVIGVVLTGLLNDGTSGMWSLKRLGGTSVIQEPEDALYPSMPERVQENVDVDYVVPAARMADLLVELTRQTSNVQPDLTAEEQNRMAREIKIAEQENAFSMNIMDYGQLSPLTCPECHGSLVSIEESSLLRFRCYTGHGFTAGALLADVNRNVKTSLWNAVRGLEEVQYLLGKKAQMLQRDGDLATAMGYLASIQQVQERAKKIRHLLFSVS
jgi:two-component system chemotaxis response regulator CheB